MAHDPHCILDGRKRCLLLHFKKWIKVAKWGIPNKYFEKIVILFFPDHGGQLQIEHLLQYLTASLGEYSQH
jgi:hypothetical protein